ncbi:hypothetical protein WOLCODRAFT_26507 [Wolfiporia cocos MD-104 SS10]|uniref:Uncharacterized protein n=1 Tax=Wolfiporia cocos (strain MD-104) TaxID=742152 RepID=A0A2H3JRL1_WOLCO|nr:hypothetical protein WOLCODRAFT_25962 [Wolfiporia cocos MD-104 SS10]PCH44135.1 hypothetical protein WOLCODRAFT_26507 [Wolfiporia cocos MD-104 SS10]
MFATDGTTAQFLSTPHSLVLPRDSLHSHQVVEKRDGPATGCVALKSAGSKPSPVGNMSSSSLSDPTNRGA